MRSGKIITTSWDDGHPLDSRIADLLDQYNLKGTFYIPRLNSEHEVMKERDIRQLATGFEIGGHSLNHVRLNGPQSEIASEITGCYNWLSGVIGAAPVSFCFPGGVYNSFAVQCSQQCGFKILRTTQLLSTSGPDNDNLLPTTLQVFQHSSFTYAGHLVKRMQFTDLLFLLKNYSTKGVVNLSLKYIEHVMTQNGIFHLWGHSWEIEKYGLWNDLESIFKSISGLDGFDYAVNGDISTC